jgi:hypothetical protein
MGEIVKSLALVGQDKINAVNPLVRLDDLIKVKRNLKCLPVQELDREARSYPADGHTDLLVSEWEKQDLYEKISLTTHEMSVLASYENDGEYYISEDLVKIVRTNSQSINNQMSAEQVIENKEGSVTLVRPFAMIEGIKVYYGIEARISQLMYPIIGVNGSDRLNLGNTVTVSEGVCKYLGYQNALDYELSSTASGNTYADMSGDGHLLGQKTKHNPSKRHERMYSYWDDSYEVYPFQSITCK